MVAVACGGHAGDAASMARVLRCCAADGPMALAHPSYPDREGFGRRTVAISEMELSAAVKAQCLALVTIARDLGCAIHGMKPHGALYHDANAHFELARVVVDAARVALGDAVIVVGPPHGALRSVAHSLGLEFWREGFADRRLRADGTLVPRSEPGAVITDPEQAAAQALSLAHDVELVTSHGDTPGALAIAAAVRQAVRSRFPTHNMAAAQPAKDDR